MDDGYIKMLIVCLLISGGANFFTAFQTFHGKNTCREKHNVYECQRVYIPVEVE